MRRGDIRTALLVCLADGPGHGYEIMQRLEEKSEGAWRPSPGSVYPALQMLTDEGLLTATEADGKRIFAITEEGREEANTRVAEHGLPWEELGAGRTDMRKLWEATRSLDLAAKQAMVTRHSPTIERVTAIIVQARKDVYRLLADLD
jgi:DNA-binding PadR family transcriptional regulator